MTRKQSNGNSVPRTTAGLRDALFDELEALRTGKSNPTKSNATAKLCSTVVETVRLDLEAQRHLERMGDAATTIGTTQATIPPVALTN